ncbi:MAG: EamA family transporter, partial [Anaerolineae bacterium]|nr:EamA family transporter [Anaerolineae bacterium]
MNKGVLYTVAAYSLWGFIAIYFKFLQNVPPLQIMSHRVVWSFILLTALLLLRRELSGLVASIRPRVLLIYLVAGVLLALNWLIYVWAVNSGHVVEGSLGYFINPLLSVVLGLIF